MLSRFLDDKYNLRVDAFIDTILYYKKRLETVSKAIETGEEFLSVVGRSRKKKLNAYIKFLAEKQLQYKREFELAERGARSVIYEKEADIILMKEEARERGVSYSSLLRLVDEEYGYSKRIVPPPKDFVPPADLPLDDPHEREQAEARIYYDLLSKGYTEERAMKLSTGPLVEVALSEIERIVKK